MQFDGFGEWGPVPADADGDVAAAGGGGGLEGLLGAAAGCRALERLLLSDNRLVGRACDRMRSDWPAGGGAAGEGDVRYITPLAAAAAACGRCVGRSAAPACGEGPRARVGLGGSGVQRC